MALVKVRPVSFSYCRDFALKHALGPRIGQIDFDGKQTAISHIVTLLIRKAYDALRARNHRGYDAREIFTMLSSARDLLSIAERQAKEMAA